MSQTSHASAEPETSERRPARPDLRRQRSARSSWWKVVLSLGLLAFVLNRVGWEQTRQALSEAHVPYLLAAQAVALIGIGVRAIRWRVLLDALGLHFSLARLTQLYFVGAFFSTCLPTGVGGDVVRAYEVAEQTDRAPEALGTVLLDRASGLLALLAMALVTLALAGSLVDRPIVVVLVLLAVGAYGGVALLLQRSWLERLGLLRLVRRFRPVAEVYEAMHACGPAAISRAVLIGMLLNLMVIAINVLFARALGVDIALGYFFLFVPIITSLLMLPVSMSGLGIREGAYVYLFAQAGVLHSQALTMSLLVYASNVLTGLVGGALYALQGLYELRAQSRSRH